VLFQVIAEMDVEDILAKQVEQLEREKRELQEKLKSQEKKVCYVYACTRFMWTKRKIFETGNLWNLGTIKFL
jgi:translation initiation factor 3 subunit A